MAGIFDGPQTRELMKDSVFNEALSKSELSAWHSLKSVVVNLLENHRSAEYEKEIQELLKSFRGMNISQNVFFAVTLGLFSKELKRFE